jgi:hypothetical protein
VAIDRTRDTLAARRAGQPKTTGSLAPIPGRCGGQLTFTGTSEANPPRYCVTWPLRGKTRCRLHNGQHQLPKDPSGALPPRIVQDYERLLKDEALLTLQKEIAWQRAYHEEIQRLGGDGALATPELFVALRRLMVAWARFRRVSASTSAPARLAASRALAAAMASLEATAAPAAVSAGMRKELRETAQTLGYLIDKENKQEDRLRNLVTLERAMALRMMEAAAVWRAIERNVTDREVQLAIRRDIAAEFDRLARRRDLPVLDAAGGSGDAGTADSTAADSGGVGRVLPADAGPDVPVG